MTPDERAALVAWLKANWWQTQDAADEHMKAANLIESDGETIARLEVEKAALTAALENWRNGEAKVDPYEIHPHWCWLNDEDYHEPRSWSCICGASALASTDQQETDDAPCDRCGGTGELPSEWPCRCNPTVGHPGGDAPCERCGDRGAVVKVIFLPALHSPDGQEILIPCPDCRPEGGEGS